MADHQPVKKEDPVKKKEDIQELINYCCFCGEECNSYSQAHSGCSKQWTFMTVKRTKRHIQKVDRKSKEKEGK